MHSQLTVSVTWWNVAFFALCNPIYCPFPSKPSISAKSKHRSAHEKMWIKQCTITYITYIPTYIQTYEIQTYKRTNIQTYKQTQHNTTQRNATQRNATQRNATQRNTTQHNARQHKTRQSNPIRPNPMHACMHACIHAYVNTCIHAYMPTCLHAYMPTCPHAHMHTCIHAYMHTCIHIHTYIISYTRCKLQWAGSHNRNRGRTRAFPQKVDASRPTAQEWTWGKLGFSLLLFRLEVYNIVLSTHSGCSR